MVIAPSVGSTIRLIIRSVVVLPQPDDPTRTVISPVGISIDRRSTAIVPSGNRFVTLSKRITTRSTPFPAIADNATRRSWLAKRPQAANWLVVVGVERTEAVDQQRVVRTPARAVRRAPTSVGRRS